jgi:hypothetical protein
MELSISDLNIKREKLKEAIGGVQQTIEALK